MNGPLDAPKKGLAGPPLRGKVAQIIDGDQLVLNFGASSGAVVGTRYRILESIKIANPDNPQEVLETLQYIKEELEVTQVLERVCIAKNAASTNMSMLWYRDLPKTSLNVDSSQMALPPDRMLIRIGDEVGLLSQPGPK